MNQKVLANENPEGQRPATSRAGNATAMKPLPHDALIVIPMRNTVLFPGVISPITVGRPASVAVLNDGSLLVADDTSGAIYRISYGNN